MRYVVRIWLRPMGGPVTAPFRASTIDGQNSAGYRHAATLMMKFPETPEMRHELFAFVTPIRSGFVLLPAVVLATVFSSNTATAQGGRTDTLVVVDAGGQPVPYANIAIGGSTAQVTNANGILVFRSNNDTLTLVTRRVGFEPYQGKIGRGVNDRIFRVTLSRSAQSLNKVVVNESMSAEPLRRNGFYDRMMEVKRGAPTGEFFTPEDLEARPMPKISDFLYSSRYAKISTTTLSYMWNPRGNGYTERSGRPRRFIQGRGGCAMTLVVDGSVMHNMLGDMKDADGDIHKAFADDRTTIDELVPGLDVMAIEVYPSTANAPMSMAGRVLGSACGLVAIWTGGR